MNRLLFEYSKVIFAKCQLYFFKKNFKDYLNVHYSFVKIEKITKEWRGGELTVSI